jgi:hypothetical protein
VALVNGTQDIVTWTAPNDGNLHSVIFTYRENCTANETGGQIYVMVYDSANNVVCGSQVSGGGTFSGQYIRSTEAPAIRPGERVALYQYTPVSAGAMTIYAELWAN